MVPVELRLTNFLSYGTVAPCLEFDQFHVACLSGRNGQGKSALLDAITWALFGEGRKSSDSRKPDADLIRIGAQHMQVELVFDLEGERYRVVRSYTRSASGKTSRPDLEVHVYEPDEGAYRPLTGANLRETQEYLDRIIGIDYDTFINSSFLLQGRSDEFTKKRPSERKQILARILNLSRYERLAERARAKERAASDRVDRADMDITRLKDALEPEAEWKAEREDVGRCIDEAVERLDAARKAETDVAEQMATLEARQREADDLREQRKRLALERRRQQQEADDLKRRIDEADALIARREQIQRDYDRYEALARERDELHTKSELFRGVEKQVHQKENELKERRNELERQLDRLDADIRSKRDAVNDCTARLAQVGAVRSRLEAAREARARLDTLDQVRQQQEDLDQKLGDLKRTLLGQREQLNGQLHSLEADIKRAEAGLPDLEELEKQQAALQQQNRQREQWLEDLETTKLEGQQLREAMEKRRGQVEALQASLAKLRQDFDRFREATDGVCPTCGTELTPSHRDEVTATYEADIQALETSIREQQTCLDTDVVRRNELAEAYRTRQQRCATLEAVPQRLAALDRDIEQARQAHEQIRQRKQQAAELRRKVEEKDYGHDERRAYQQARDARDKLAFDAEAYQQCRDQAGQRGDLEKRLKELEEVAGKRDQLEQHIEQSQQRAATLRKQLDDGSAFGALPGQIDALRQQLNGIGFDPGRFEEVRQALNALSQAGARLKDLVHAQQNQEEWRERLAGVQQRIGEIGNEDEQLADRLGMLEKTLAERSSLQARQQEARQTRIEAEQALQRLQRRSGELDARLAQAKEDRAALAEARKERKAAARERTLYRHLKTAFGKNGIPSLIIEQTLPEIEERANDLLERLTDGKMHVRLETLKDKKTGGTKETLNIIITDEQGIPRPYETFSGGEAFRANFALRIALSQLLAERADVRIRTLVIDEGFGTQDAQGIENLVEAIQVIKDDFEKIIVITHLEELKEAFPVRIEVAKDPTDGSSFEVLGV